MAQRLPSNAVPSHYSLKLTPDLRAATFAGSETIDVNLTAPSATVTLNSAEIRIAHVAARVAGAVQDGSVSYDVDKEQATFTFASVLPAGPVELSLEYTGVLNDQLRGFYLSKTKTRSYAVTQFESTDARRAFPSFDEPALKATFDVALTVDKGDTVIANTNQVSDVAAGPGKHTLTFARTPRMSTYLVAFQVGDFVCSHGSADGIPIGACSTPDKLPLTKLALESAEHFLHYYDTYFGVKYPMPKLDMVAIPDFEAGAMENFGCITYRETDFLVDASHATLDQRKRVAVVVAHEMAHQWFGDLVTMQWWDNLWLNEGFATWMESKAVREWQPTWGLDEDEAAVLNTTLNQDAAETTRTIRSRAETPAEIDQQFDGLSYGKAGAVLSMVEHYLGPEVFQKGVHNYLVAHSFGNATAEDFWEAQTVNSGRPVDRIMSSFVTQPGVPLLRFSAPKGGRVNVEQSRFFLASAPTAQSWTVPVCVGATCQLASGAKSTIGAAGVAYRNGDDRGYYRSAYDAATLTTIVAGAETTLTVPERIGLVGDQWALVRSGSGSVAELLSLAHTLRTDRNGAVLEALAGDPSSYVSLGSAPFTTIRDHIADDAQRAALQQWERKTYGPELAAMGSPATGESESQKAERSGLFYLLGMANDAAVQNEAMRMAEGYVDGKRGGDPQMVANALFVAAAHGNAKLYGRVLRLYETTANPQEKRTALTVLTRFSEPALLTRTLEYTASGKVPNQDSAAVFAQLLTNDATREGTWTYIKANWAKVSAQFTAASGRRVVGATGNFCSATELADVETFFAAHTVANADRSLRGALEQIDGCVRLRKKQAPLFAEWLKGQ